MANEMSLEDAYLEERPQPSRLPAVPCQEEVLTVARCESYAGCRHNATVVAVVDRDWGVSPIFYLCANHGDALVCEGAEVRPLPGKEAAAEQQALETLAEFA
jgi:hypothetical protein